ncbi:GNAT family N-acetyltransferase [Chryseobacterium indologenes]|uniref:GNAT family N-acetyltransferase n=1 Tax=Chryseobacterium indologenes TaxID=253 RepID=UPI00162A98A3|nr:GNAT family N-acetyltransferase [Chryseobacterium indologenes]
MENTNIEIRNIIKEDCEIISEAFKKQNWNKPIELYHIYLKEQYEGKRITLVLYYESEFAGYLTILWNSEYSFFHENSIPEIQDLNVLIKFRKRGIATKLMEHAENIISKKSNIVGIGVGLTSDYGNAQRLYIRRSYLPDGKGISQNGEYLSWGKEIIINDDLVLYLSKELNNNVVSKNTKK